MSGRQSGAESLMLGEGLLSQSLDQLPLVPCFQPALAVGISERQSLCPLSPVQAPESHSHPRDMSEMLEVGPTTPHPPSEPVGTSMGDLSCLCLVLRPAVVM